ncbi:MAG: S9 family peptidase [Dehalococcoidales bacterium]|nr:S9 family peptidase [Dehalococcoidales bacterium]
MAGPKVAPYGSWESPITSDLIVSKALGLGEIKIDGQDIYWLEARPWEGGRSVVVRRTAAGDTADVTPAPFNVRTRVHEYGGGAFTVSEGIVYFADFADQRLYQQAPGVAPQPLTPEGAMRYADLAIDRSRQRLICVREDYAVAGHEPTNTLVGLALEGGDSDQVLVSGGDFYSSPRLNHIGDRLAWVTWHHPHMPWDASELWVGEVLPDGTIGSPQRVAGGERESVQQPMWSPEGTLYFISDRTGWWNLYRWRDGRSEPLHEMAAEFGVPHWVFGLSTYGVISEESLICTYGERGISHLATLNTETGALEAIPVSYSTVAANLQVGPGFAAFVGGSSNEPSAVVRLDLASKEITTLRRSSEVEIDQGYLSLARPIEFPTEEGRMAYAFFYRPRNRDYEGPAGERPPLLVKSHGGPTAATSPNFRLDIQYWTSRGIAVLDVNYGGSTGYGREYRQRLNGQWGILDVEDCVNGALHLMKEGEIDRERMAISGGSAGGYTTLCALTFRDVFNAGASYYGVSDLEALAKDTHKFESRYLDSLIGPYPERRDEYLARSPINFVYRLSCPVIFFQGLEDQVVPPNQTELMVNALRQKRIPVAYLPFPGEQHGFRRAENIKRSLDAELYFYGKVFGFELATAVEPVAIENLPG